MSEQPSGKKTRGQFLRSLLRWGALAIALAGLVWLAFWLMQRSFMSQNKKRAMQSWLDDNLNADVRLGGSMAVRFNVVRPSRLTLRQVEVEHPNPLFSSKFASVDSITAWVKPWSILRLWPDLLDIDANGVRLTFEENEAGEWSVDGLMNPLDSGQPIFPFPIPKISDWRTDVRNSLLLVRRRGRQFELHLDADLTGRPDSDLVTLVGRKMPFRFGPIDGTESEPLSGAIGPLALVARLGGGRGQRPSLVPGRSGMDVDRLPARVLPFLVPGIPLDNVDGVFNGRAVYRARGDAAGSVHLEGELQDVPLAVFGLPRNAPIRLEWPIAPQRDGLAAEIRMGPSGFGAFAIDIPLDGAGRPKQLVMRGDVASLDDVPGLFTIGQSRWPDWLSRTFPSIEWRAGSWLGFGWSGKDMLLSLNRSTTGLNLTGEAELMNGRVRISMTPEQRDAPVTVAAERLDVQLLAVKFSQMLPETFRAQISGAHANFSWRGLHMGGGAVGPWGSGIVFAKPVVDIAASGSWWRGLSQVNGAIVADLPEWGGGDAAALEALLSETRVELEQMSIVAENNGEGGVAVEFRAYGESIGQATGLIERYADGQVQGEMFLAGRSKLIDTVGAVNPEFGLALELIARETLGLRVLFTIPPDGEPEFSFPFLDDARQIREALANLVGGGEEGEAESAE